VRLTRTPTVSARSSAWLRGRLHRGRKIGAMLVEQVEAPARREGLRGLVLRPAIAIWRRGGVYESWLTRCGPVLDYADSQLSVFRTKSRWRETVRGPPFVLLRPDGDREAWARDHVVVDTGGG
jgi:hypothetical protein